ncbi:hypothetical protein [Caballeronia arationis]|uniref:hypothetical protein n=1 Tax=Caballeronia arationis TaxID=1777142 RepID=UPI00119822E4|nr:hypothetical protein [Caballeronia arationis]
MKETPQEAVLRGERKMPISNWAVSFLTYLAAARAILKAIISSEDDPVPLAAMAQGSRAQEDE